MRGSRLLVSALLVPLLAGCESREETAVAPANAPGTLNDRQIMGVLAELSLAEMHGAEIAGPIVVTPAAKALAAQFLAEAQVTIPALLGATPVTPAGSDITDKLIHDQITAFDIVTSQQGIAIDVAYYCVQLRGQADALDLIDTELAPNAQDPTVAAVVQQARSLLLLHQQETLAAAAPFQLTAASPLCNPGS